MKRNNMSVSDIQSDETFLSILKKMSFASPDDMFAAIGYGGLSAQKIVNRLRDEMRHAVKQPVSSETQRQSRPEEKKRPVHGVIIEGIDNCLVKFSRCCMPVPGDDIVGFITRGYGVSVHRKDCNNYICAMEEKNEADRWVAVSWGGTEETYQTGIYIRARERDGLVLDIATVISGLKMKIDSLSARDMGDGNATVYLTVEVRSLFELTELAKHSGFRASGDKKNRRRNEGGSHKVSSASVTEGKARRKVKGFLVLSGNARDTARRRKTCPKNRERARFDVIDGRMNLT